MRRVPCVCLWTSLHAVLVPLSDEARINELLSRGYRFGKGMVITL